MYRSDVDSMMAICDDMAECEAELNAARDEDMYNRVLSVLTFIHEQDARMEAVNSIADYLECGGIPVICEVNND